jgi:hypothetical protein
MAYEGTLARRQYQSIATAGSELTARIGIDLAHQTIHSGKHFFYSDSIELGAAAIQVYLLTVPAAAYPHVLIFLEGSAVTTFELYEGADRTGTTAQTTYNNNRNSATAAKMTIHKDVSGGTTDGVLLAKSKGGASGGQFRSGSRAGNNEEYILEAGTKYIIKITSGTAGNNINVLAEWYEIF